MNFENMAPAEIAARFPYGQVEIWLDLARSVSKEKTSQQLTREIGNLEVALVLCTGEFIPGARNVH
ncbi:hypothetical protein FJZ19_05015 [Candidatus Pacearchaeota archaeon]|nr:hypothetical protein [Candidatus Pacearchaeota archaeon]